MKYGHGHTRRDQEMVYRESRTNCTINLQQYRALPCVVAHSMNASFNFIRVSYWQYDTTSPLFPRKSGVVEVFRPLNVRLRNSWLIFKLFCLFSLLKGYYVNEYKIVNRVQKTFVTLRYILLRSTHSFTLIRYL